MATISSTGWRYRTKEFNFKSQKPKQLKRFRVEFEGNLTVEIYRDRKLMNTFNFSSSEKTQKYFYVRGLRGHTFSFRFLGDTSTILYKYSLD